MRPLLDYWESGGPLMIPLAILSFASWYWVLALSWRVRKASVGLQRAQQSMRTHAASAKREWIQRWSRVQRGLAARFVGYVLQDDLDSRTVRSRCTEARLAEIPGFRIELGLLKAMVAAAPLLGLLGTVRGMVSTFSVLATRGTASVALLSSGISEALVTTQVGLVVAIPGLAGVYAIGRSLAGLDASLQLLESELVAGAQDIGRIDVTGGQP